MNKIGQWGLWALIAVMAVGSMSLFVERGQLMQQRDGMAQRWQAQKILYDQLAEETASAISSLTAQRDGLAAEIMAGKTEKEEGDLELEKLHQQLADAKDLLSVQAAAGQRQQKALEQAKAHGDFGARLAALTEGQRITLLYAKEKAGLTMQLAETEKRLFRAEEKLRQAARLLMPEEGT